MSDTPIYDELVVKYYLSKGIVPFSYPHVEIDAPVLTVSIDPRTDVVSVPVRSRYFNLKG